MPDPRIDAYIEKAAPFAQPVLKKLRQLIHTACPDITETIKWGMPSFEFKGPMCGFAAFKKHAAFGFWNHSLIEDPMGYLQEFKSKGGDAMGNLGCITSLKDLPPDRVMLGFIKQAVKLNEKGIKVVRKKTSAPKKLVMHEAFVNGLNKKKTAKTFFNSLAPGQQREYAQWINEAKTDTTRNSRISTALEWLADGKRRNWKYESKK